MTPIYLGPGAQPHQERHISVPAGRCSVDTDFGREPQYAVGEKAGVYVWRQGTPYLRGEPRAEPDEATLRALKALGYL